MEIKSNPFVLFTDDEADFDKVQALLIELFPGQVVVWEALTSNGLDKIDDIEAVRVGHGSYRAQFSLSPKIPEPLDAKKVVEAFTWVYADLLEQAKTPSAKRYGLIRLYKADAKNYADAATLIEKGFFTDGVKALARMDTAARGRIWGAPIVQENNDEFIMFLHKHKYPNILSNGSVY